MVLCPNCGKQNEESFNFCIYCGTKLIKKCAKCGKINDYDSNFCIYCGNNLKNDNSKIQEEFEEKIENNDSSDLGIIYLGGSTIDDSEIEKDSPTIDSSKIKSESTENRQDIDINLNEKQNDTNIENKDKHKKAKIEQNNLSKNSSNKPKENNNSSDLGIIYLGGSTIDDSEIEKDSPNIDSNKVKSKSTKNKPNINKNLIKQISRTNIKNKNNHKKAKKEQDNYSKNSRKKLKENNNSSDLEIKKNNQNTRLNKVNSKSAENRLNIDKNVNKKLNDSNIKNKDNHKKTKKEQKHTPNKIKKEQNYHSKNPRNKLKENNNSSDLGIKNNNPNTNSNKAKSKSTDYKPNINKNLIKQIYGTNIKNKDNHKKAKIKQKHTTNKIKKEQNNLSKNTKEKLTEAQSEVKILPSVKTINCDLCGNEILKDDSSICKSCQIRVSNFLDLLCADFEINTKIPLKYLYSRTEEYKVSEKDFRDITRTLNKFNYLHKIHGKILIDYNRELRNFIDKNSTKTANKNDDIENKVILVTEKIGLNTPFDTEYLKETLNFKNSEISKMIIYLEEKNAIIEDEDYFILVDKSNEMDIDD